MAAKNNPSQTAHKMGASWTQVNMGKSVPDWAGERGKGGGAGSRAKEKNAAKGQEVTLPGNQADKKERVMSIDAISGGGGYNMPSISEMRQKMFKKMDQDGDGVISQSECETAAQEMSQKTGLSITADQMMSIFDLDQDGVITQAEQTEASPTWEEHMKDLMEAAGIKPMGPPPPPPEMGGELSELVKEILAAVDTDGDGAISKTEYDAAMQQLGVGQESDATSSTASAATEETGLAALLAQLLEMLTKMEEDSYSQYAQESQNYQGMNSYA